MAGKWIGEGKEIQVVKLMALGWNASNTPPLDHDIVTSTCEGILRTHQNNHPVARVGGDISLLFDLNEAKVHNMICNPPPQRKWLLNDCLPYGKVGMIIAPGGTGKSMLALQLSVSLATGDKFVDYWEIGEVGASLLLFGEEDTEEIHRRLHNVVASLGQTSPTKISDIESRVHAKSMTGIDNQMTRSLPAGSVTLTDYADRLILTANQITNLKLIIIDPASRFRGGNENAAEDTTRFVESLERVCQQTGATVLVLHHANKISQSAGEANQNASRGSSAMTDGVRWQMNLSRPSKEDARKSYGIPENLRHNYLLAAVTKNNYGPPQNDVVLMRGEHGILHVSNEHLSTPKPEEILIALLKSETAAGRVYSANAFEKQFGGEQKTFKMGILAVRKLINAAIARNLIQKQRGKTGVLKIIDPPIQNVR
ncbi:helicase RepA family protein [Glaciimonas sp. CA11.2]|uniref:AAA family ATPase n=1 Tax=Glaciimonas sp. CA11.2 TaxID=3048601 RepID=UPI002B232CE6|nr:helicase RepA family protein [Glaciimonas sp. CA11.2]